ncbi:CTP synthase 2 [Toxocara canis]|uniref:CTP synthase n=1 Tax=Toxocara canis TaxID=6265 RepID=A0A0B2VE73_TOXCA|nr:CTP synthase 2 [Toxocara canis]
MGSMKQASPGLPPVKMVLVTGGVISGVGKGIISSSLGVLLKAHGYRVSAIKIDPYINIDAGTFSPFEHGEVFVLDDGGEVDLDLGNYERFLNVRLTRDNNITTGKIYQHVIERERRGDYLGKTVQTIPHVTGAIVDWVERVAAIPVDGTDQRPDVCIIELGGTIGDIEGMPFVAAFEKFQRPAYRDLLMTVHVSLVLDPKTTGEPKTKPMQNSVRNLRASGLIPDLLMCRSEKPLSKALREKIAAFGMVEPEQVIGVHDVANIYKVPLLLHQQNVLEMITERLKLPHVDALGTVSMTPNMFQWTHLSNLCDSFSEEVRIALVGKYVRITDAYASVNKALRHAAIHAKRKLIIEYVDAEYLEESTDPERIAGYNKAWDALRRSDGILVPGGFGDRGIEGKIAACEYARVNGVPFLGVCLGMQCAAIEFARNVLGIKHANSTEFDKALSDDEQVVIDMPEHDAANKGAGGTMRLGLRETVFLTDICKLRKLYGARRVSERHRHRYEVNPEIVPKLSRAGLLFVGMGTDEKPTSVVADRRTQSSATLVQLAEVETQSNSSQEDLSETVEPVVDNNLLTKIEELCRRGGDGKKRTAIRMEMLELQGHPYFVGVQYHPEYLSHPLQPSPPFFGLVCAASNQLEGLLRGSKIPSPMTVLKSAENYSKGLTNGTLHATHSFVNKMGSLNEQVDEYEGLRSAGDAENTKMAAFEVTQTSD